MTTEIEAPAHVLIPEGSGFFSRGTCTGCPWEFKGHIDEVVRLWQKYHEDHGNVSSLPQRLVVSPITGDVFVDRVEQRIIELLTHYVDFNSHNALLVTQGLSEARSFYLNNANMTTERAEALVLSPTEYVSTLMGRIAHLSARQREKLRMATRSRQELQEILEG